MICALFPASTWPKAIVELAVPVVDQELKPGGAFAEVHEQVAGLLGRSTARWGAR
jgi:hypothetical protein